jgi:hypothetical protein
MTNILIYLSFLLLWPSTDIQEVVKEFHALKTEEAEIEFIKKYQHSTNPSVLAYAVSIEMKQAEYSYNPLYSIKVFKTNKQRLNELIALHDSNIHLRYVRLLAQLNAPTILGYNDFIEADKAFLKEKLAVKDETDYLDKYIKANTSL